MTQITLDFDRPEAPATAPLATEAWLTGRLREVGWPNPAAEAREMLDHARDYLRRYSQDAAYTWLYGPLPNGPGLCRLTVPREAVFPKRK